MRKNTVYKVKFHKWAGEAMLALNFYPQKPRRLHHMIYSRTNDITGEYKKRESIERDQDRISKQRAREVTSTDNEFLD